MKMLQKGNIFLLGIFCICVITSRITVCADDSFTFPKTEKNETANDLFRLYNETELAEITQMQEDYLKAKDLYDKAASEAEMSEIFNSILEDMQEWKEQKQSEIDAEINDILKQNEKVAIEISNEIGGKFSMLAALDAQYKVNTNVIQELLNERNKYSLTREKIVDYNIMDILEKEMKEIATVYEEAVEVATLGDVSCVKYPLGAKSLVTSKYGDRIDPMTGSSIRFHSGLDLRAANGTSVLSLFNGVVVGTGFTAAGGNYVRIDHGNGIISYYCHLSEIKCESGQKVSQYEVVALSGNTGSRTTGPHLHLALYINGNSVNPEILFNR